jgi:peptide/nickel transport system ATP-binding protein
VHPASANRRAAALRNPCAEQWGKPASLQRSRNQLNLFVSHDLNVLRLLCDRVIVMQAGQIVEQGPTDQVLVAPQTAYTRDLLTAIPHPPL